MLRDVTPARAGEFDDLLGQLVEVDRQQRLVLLAFPVEVAHPRDDVGDVVAGGFDVVQISVGGLTEVLLVPEEQFREPRHGGEGVVDVVGNAAGHLSQGTKTLVLHDGLLGLAEFVVSALQLRVQSGLMRGQRDVFAERAQKFAFADAEAVGLGAGGDEDPEKILLHHHRHHDG